MSATCACGQIFMITELYVIGSLDDPTIYNRVLCMSFASGAFVNNLPLRTDSLILHVNFPRASALRFTMARCERYSIPCRRVNFHSAGRNTIRLGVVRILVPCGKWMCTDISASGRSPSPMDYSIVLLGPGSTRVRWF